jgi:hypothetical protein
MLDLSTVLYETFLGLDFRILRFQKCMYARDQFEVAHVFLSFIDEEDYDFDIRVTSNGEVSFSIGLRLKIDFMQLNERRRDAMSDLLAFLDAFERAFTSATLNDPKLRLLAVTGSLYVTLPSSDRYAVDQWKRLLFRYK